MVSVQGLLNGSSARANCEVLNGGSFKNLRHLVADMDSRPLDGGRLDTILATPKSRARRLAFSGTSCRAAALAAKSRLSKVARLSRICVSSAGVVPNTLTLSDFEYLAAPSFQD